MVGAAAGWRASGVSVKQRRGRIAQSKAKVESVAPAPEILQVIAGVAEIMLDQRRQQADVRNASSAAA